MNEEREKDKGDVYWDQDYGTYFACKVLIRLWRVRATSPHILVDRLILTEQLIYLCLQVSYVVVNLGSLLLGYSY